MQSATVRFFIGLGYATRSKRLRTTVLDNMTQQQKKTNSAYVIKPAMTYQRRNSKSYQSPNTEISVRSISSCAY